MGSLLRCTLSCSNEKVQNKSARARSIDDTRKRILDVALEVLGQNPDSGMGDIASAAQDLRVARLPVPENALLGAGGGIGVMRRTLR